jgi:hypothetical protein
VVDTTLRPKLLRIGRRRYRTAWPDDASALHAYHEDGDDGAMGDVVAVHRDAIEQQADGQLRMAMAVPPAFYGKLVGRQGRTHAQLERDTAVRVQVRAPERGAEGEMVEREMVEMG